MTVQVRRAKAEDADDISSVVLAAVRDTNAKDYPARVIEQIAQSYNANAVLDLITERQFLVAVLGGRVVGTASLNGCVVQTVFISPDVQGQGVGRLLMGEIEQVARDAGLTRLTVPSSITAETFYSRLGYRAVRDNYDGEERTIIMERDLVAP